MPRPFLRPSVVAMLAGFAAGAGCDGNPAAAPPVEAAAVVETDVSEPTDPTPAAPIVEADASDAFPTFGVSLTPPEGWEAEAKLPQSGFLGRWLPKADDPDDWSQFAIDIRPLRGDPNARRAAEQSIIARLEQAGYRRSEVTLDGVTATRLDAPPTPAGAERRPVPSPVLIANRSRLLYRALFLMNDPAVTPEADSVIAGWRWNEPAPVVDHLLAEAPVSVFAGLGELRVPAVARVDREFTTGETKGFTIYDYRRGEDAILFVCEQDLKPDPSSLREHVVAYAEQIEGRTRLEMPLAFERFDGREDLYASETLRGEFDEGGVRVARMCRYAVWRPRPGALIRIQAVINNEVFVNDGQLAVAVAAVRRMLASCSAMKGFSPE